MRERLLGYWALSWVGLISNIIALPIIALIISYGPPLKVANITLAISLGWPAAIVGIVSSDQINQQIYDSLLLLQHRGQDSTGIATMEESVFHLHKSCFD